MTTLGPFELGPETRHPAYGIYYGDARQLARHIPDESVGLVLTDPPFGIGFSYSSGYRDDPGRYVADILSWLVPEINRVLVPGGYAFVFQARLRLRETWQHFPADSRIFAVCKNFAQAGRGEILESFDPVVFWRKGDVARLPGEHRRDWFIANTARTGGRRDNAFHDCPRPLDVIEYIVDRFSLAGDVVLDLFAGSGTTCMAARRAGRRYLAFELDLTYCAGARERVRNAQPPLLVPQAEQLGLEITA